MQIHTFVGSTRPVQWNNGGHCTVYCIHDKNLLSAVALMTSSAGMLGKLYLALDCGNRIINVSCRHYNTNNDRRQEHQPSVPVDVHLPITQLSPSTPLALGSVMLGLLNLPSVGNNSTTIANAIIEGLDILLLTETRHTMSEDVSLRRCVPPDYSLIDVPRPTAN